MGIFSKESLFDAVVEKATLDTNTKEDWSVILDICDKVSTTPQAPKECLRSLIKRLNNSDPHVVMQAATLLDACINNCGKAFHLEIASREFEQEYTKIISKATEKQLRDKLLGLLEKWATTEFKTDPQLDLIPSLYNKLKLNGFHFPSVDSPSKAKKTSGSSHHKSKVQHGGGAGMSSSASASQQEADDIAKAIELSLKETQNSSTTKSLYPQGLGSSSANSSNSTSVAEPRKVRALYDFEAAEDNELTFYAGEIVHVLDDSDTNWWQGSNQRGTGLFPSNFVTADLSAEAPKIEPGSKKSVQFNDEVEVKTVENEPEVVEIDESKIDAAIHVLHEADPTGEIPDPPSLMSLQEQVIQMGPLIDMELDKIDRRHAQLTLLGSELVDALNMYHHLMRDPAQPSGMPYNPRMPGGLPALRPNTGPNYGGIPPPTQPWNPHIPGSYYPQAPTVPNQSGLQYDPVLAGMLGPPQTTAGLPNGLPPQNQPQPIVMNNSIISQIPQNVPRQIPMGYMGQMIQHQQQPPPQELANVYPGYSLPQ